MNDPIPSDLLKLKIRLDAWRKKRKYVREPIPDELRRAASEMCRRYPHSLIRRVLKIHPDRLKSPSATPSARTRVRKRPPSTFFELPIGGASPEPVSSSPPECTIGSRLVIERPDGARLTIFLSSLDQASISVLCANFLRSR
jgi:hypothetical protein